ncbi:MAG: oligosaccharide flippase family protein [Pirellulaceae bacterium]
MSTVRVYARNLAANWIGSGANLVVMLFLSPFVIHTLGLAGYGLWSALNVLVGYMGVLDLGIRASTGRHIILYVGRGDHKSVDETIRTSLGFFSVIGIGFVVGGLLLGRIFPSLFPRVPPEYQSLLVVLLPVMAANLWMSMFGAVFSSLLSAHDRFDLSRGLGLVELGFRTAATVATLSLGYGIAGLVFVTVGCQLFHSIGIYLLAKRVYPRTRAWPPILRRARLRELFGYGIPAALSAAAIKIIGQTDVIIVSAFIGFSAAGIFTTGANWLYYSHTLLGQISATLFPPLQRAVARGEFGAAKWLFYRQLRLTAIAGLPLFVGFICFGQAFLHLWLYEPVAFPEAAVKQAAAVMAILAASKLLILFWSGATSLLAAMGHIRITAALSVAEALLNVALSLLFVLVFDWGIAGVAAGTLASRLLTSSLALPWFTCRIAKLSLRHLLLDTGGRLVVTGICFAGVCLLMPRIIPGETWAVFALQVGLALVCYLPLAMILVPKNDRERVFRNLKLVVFSNAARADVDPMGPRI